MGSCGCNLRVCLPGDFCEAKQPHCETWPNEMLLQPGAKMCTYWGVWGWRPGTPAFLTLVAGGQVDRIVLARPGHGSSMALLSSNFICGAD